MARPARIRSILWLIAIAALPGCASSRVDLEGTVHQAVRTPAGLRSEIDMDVRTVAAAAERSLVRRGYVIIDDRATADRGVVVGKTPAQGIIDRWFSQKVRVIADRRGGRTLVSVNTSPARSESTASEILTEIYESLGR